jgi:hypothetical protein
VACESERGRTVAWEETRRGVDATVTPDSVSGSAAIETPSIASEQSARATRAPGAVEVTIQNVDGNPVEGAQVVLIGSNDTFHEALTDHTGTAPLRVPARQPVVLFAARSEYEPLVVAKFDEHQHARLTMTFGGPTIGSAIFTDGTGHLPCVSGRLNPILDAQRRYYLYAKNISISDGAGQPVHFSLGERLQLEDADGREARVTIVDLRGRTSLLAWEAIAGLVDRLRAQLAVGLALLDEIPDRDPDGVAAARAVASGSPVPTTRSDVDAWMNEVSGLLSDHPEWLVQFRSRSVASNLADMGAMKNGTYDHARALRGATAERLEALRTIVADAAS